MKLVLVQPPPPRDSTASIDAIAAALERANLALSEHDLLLLPEHVRSRGTRADYLGDLARITERFSCHVIGGSFHEVRDDHAVNAGVVLGPAGDVLADYEKVRPYALERQHVVPGVQRKMLRVAGRELLILICADFWFTDLAFRAPRAPDVILVPAFSVTRKPSPDYSRSLWRHLAIARAYELGVYVGVSDWAHDPTSLFRTSGVGGFADPTTLDPDTFFTPIGDSGVACHQLDFDALDAFRADRVARGFFWREAEV